MHPHRQAGRHRHAAPGRHQHRRFPWRLARLLHHEREQRRFLSVPQKRDHQRPVHRQRAQQLLKFMRAKLVFLSAFFLLHSAFALTTYYVDSSWTGAQAGTSDQPWVVINGHWGTINTALASGPVTINFTARQVGSDARAIYTSTNGTLYGDSVDVTQRSDTSANVLTFDGSSWYNTSEVAPNWIAYSGT